MGTPPDRRWLAAGLIDRAAADLVAVSACAGQAADEITGFHAQQAVEKALKAVLALRSLVPPRTHDLLALRGLLEDAGSEPPLSVDELAALYPYAVEFRYTFASEPQLATERMYDLASRAIAWARAELEDQGST
jgi:HEPN domain-containing protein